MSDNTIGRKAFEKWYNAQQFSARSCWEAYKAGFENALAQVSDDVSADMRTDFNRELRLDKGEK